MVTCTFCGYPINLGTGKMLVLKDGKVQYFCTMKCEKNLHKLGRKPRTTEWTKAYAIQKAADKAAAAHAAAGTSAKPELKSKPQPAQPKKEQSPEEQSPKEQPKKEAEAK